MEQWANSLEIGKSGEQEGVNLASSLYFCIEELRTGG